MKNFSWYWLPLIGLILSGFGTVYNQGLRIEHRLTTLEAKLDMHLQLSSQGNTVGRVSLVELKYGHPGQSNFQKGGRINENR